MFVITKDNFIKSDEGFSVKVSGGRAPEVKYIQSGKSLIIGSERLFGHYTIVIYATQIKKWNTGELIDESTKEQIVNNIVLALSWNGEIVEIHSKDRVFSKPKPNIIECDDGFSVEILGETTFRYTQSGKIVYIEYEKIRTGPPNFLESEILAHPYTIVLNLKSLNTWDSGEIIDQKTKSLVKMNIVLAFLSAGYEVIEVNTL